MMDNLEKVISVLFKRVSVQEIIEGKISSANIKGTDFVQLMRTYSNVYSDTELHNLYQYLISTFVDQFYGAERIRYGRKLLDVFALLQYYSEWILTEQDNEIVCEYSKLLHWRMITQELSEDLFTISYLVSKMKKNITEQVRFDWKTVISHNNRELHRILEQGIAENHSHLKGASSNFPLTWVSIMNNLYLSLYSQEIRRIDQNRRNVNIKYKLSYEEKPLMVQLLQAACIRFLMFKLICRTIWGMDKAEAETMDKYVIWLQDPDRFMDIRGELASEIHSVQNLWEDGILPDYALAGFLEEGGDKRGRLLIVQGERWLLYHFFSAAFSDTKLGFYRNLFYAYLVIKENFRGEIIQNNNCIGFENFRIYENRKDVFLDSPVFNGELVKKVVEANFAESRVVVAEGRIAPKASAYGYCKYIERMDQLIGARGKYQNRFFYTLHFIKRADKEPAHEYMMCRHWKERKIYRRQAIDFVEFREKYPRYAERIRGMDAANMEIGCGPEVFAQVFRYLSDHRFISKAEPEIKVPQLRKTFHVAEDFLDLVSGIRSVDESIRFLGMKCGDRLGHALGLGIDANEWYKGKNYRILLSQQEYLDNIAWMYHLCVSFHIDDQGNRLNFLKREYDYYFQIIYRNAMDQNILEHINREAKKYYKSTEWEKYYSNITHEFTIENYYSAWKLRGDNPELYRDGFFANREIVENICRSFSYYSIDRTFPRRQNLRYFQENALLYYYYHFDEDVRKEGGKLIEKKIGREYIECARILQREMQKVVAENGIAIETNPSSNFLISTFKRYDKHPIINFYNKYLVENSEILQKCPQICVSINTDDAGIFNTSLENEYAYMALALEKAKDAQGNRLFKKRNIYEWLNHIRIMGLRQTFLSDEEMKKAMCEWNEEYNWKDEVPGID